MQDRDLCELDEFGGHAEAAVLRGKARLWRFGGAEQFRLMATHGPDDVGRFHIGQRQHPRRLAPAMEISLAIEGDVMHVLSSFRHCEERSDEAIHLALR